MDFLNSSFGIWLLSTVAVGAVTYLHTQWKAWRDSKEARKQDIFRIDVEIAARLDRVKSVVLREEPAPTQSEFIAAQQVLREGGDHSVYPDFEKRTTRALVVRLMFLLEQHERGELNGTLEYLDRFLAVRVGRGGDIAMPPDVPESVRSELRGIDLRRWQLRQMARG